MITMDFFSNETILLKIYLIILSRNNRILFYTILPKNKSIFEQYLSKFLAFFYFFRLKAQKETNFGA